MRQENPRHGLVFGGIFLIFFAPACARAHFGAVIPARSMLDQSHGQVTILFAFMHPFEQNSMTLAKPRKAAVVNMETLQQQVVTPNLDPVKFLGHAAWQVSYRPRRPAVYCIYMIPQPYWEPAEDHYIQHITKTYIAAYGAEDGWEKPVGLATEIVPLSRPFGLYAGNVFRGRVYVAGVPAPDKRVEVEYYNRGGSVKAASEYMITQVVRTDEQGIFVYSPPAAGWWAFAALSTAEHSIKHNGAAKSLELGAVIWVRFLPWPK